MSVVLADFRGSDRGAASAACMAVRARAPCCAVGHRHRRVITYHRAWKASAVALPRPRPRPAPGSAIRRVRIRGRDHATVAYMAQPAAGQGSPSVPRRLVFFTFAARWLWVSYVIIMPVRIVVDSGCCGLPSSVKSRLYKSQYPSLVQGSVITSPHCHGGTPPGLAHAAHTRSSPASRLHPAASTPPPASPAQHPPRPAAHIAAHLAAPRATPSVPISSAHRGPERPGRRPPAPPPPDRGQRLSACLALLALLPRRHPSCGCEGARADGRGAD